MKVYVSGYMYGHLTSADGRAVWEQITAKLCGLTVMDGKVEE